VSSVDTVTAREVFERAQDFTVGIEEEFAILDPATLELAPRFEELSAAAASDPVLPESISSELILSEIEIRSGRNESFADAVVAQRDARRRLFALAHARGMALGATGTHPFSDYRDQRFIETEHYRRVAEGLQYVAKRNNTFSLHVHVGVRGPDRAVRVCDRLRPVLPLLLAISANSPYLDARDSGLHSARSQAFTKSFPRCGVPDAFGGWAAYAEYVDFLVRTGSIIEFTQVWWSIRPHFAFGTVEVRICDAQSTATESEGLAALMTACVAQAARDEDEGVPFVNLAPRLIEENVWRAIRFGLDGELIDLGAPTNAGEAGRSLVGETYPAPEAVDRLLSWTAPMRAELGLEVALPELNGAQRQRRLIDAGAPMEEVYAAVVRETRDTYAQEVPA
jgi:carboxylate-amine ligase